jgi:hypothetical protein
MNVCKKIQREKNYGMKTKAFVSGVYLQSYSLIHPCLSVSVRGYFEIGIAVRIALKPLNEYIIAMKKNTKLPTVPGLFRLFFCFTALCGGFMLTACTSSPSASDKSSGFSAALGKDWRLVGIRSENGDISLDRSLMEAEGVGDAFTLRFEEERINGMALPNRYFGPYVQEGQSISFKGIASTLMAGSNELDVLKEHEYFGYLDRVQSWAWRRGRLELQSTTPQGQPAILIYN